MRLRPAAACGGLIVIGVALLAYSLPSHPNVAGTTSAAPLTPSVSLAGERERCQRISRVPGGADQLRLWVGSTTSGVHVLRARVSSRDSVVSAGSWEAAASGPVLIPLRPRTQATQAATLCLSAAGRGQVVLLGELKRIPGSREGEGTRRAVANAAFLRPGVASWAAQRTTIAERFANSRAGMFSGWTLYGAIVLAVVAAGLGLILVTRRWD